MRHLVIILAVLCAALVAAKPTHPHFLSDEFIESINKAATTWKARRNFAPNTPLKYMESLTGVLPGGDEYLLPLDSDTPDVTVPVEFDSRTQWPNCESISEIRDQGPCKSCWAIASAQVMSNRQCIVSNGTQKHDYSTEDLLSCCPMCGLGCEGGYPWTAFNYWALAGIVSGGDYNSGEGCKPYSIPPCSHLNDGSEKPPCGETVQTPQCSKTCQPNYEVDYFSDRKSSYFARLMHSNEARIMTDMYLEGPVAATFSVYEDFFSYSEGVYQHTTGEMVGRHAVRILGWGVEDGVKYWLCANSWNSEWGDEGYFKILRGVDHCYIESRVVVGHPRL